MRRLLLCLPLSLLVAPEPAPRPASAPIQVALLPPGDNDVPLPTENQLARLARTDPVGFIEACQRRIAREVKGYRCLLKKQERLAGKLKPSELIEAQFREDPFSVYLNWKEGTRLAQRVLYVKGENKDKLLVKPAGLAAIIGIVERDPEGDEAKQSGRYPMTEFGMKYGIERTLLFWKKAQKEKALTITYLGVRKVPELNDRPCHVFKRTGYAAPEEDGITDNTTYIDAETWLQVGSVLKGAEGQLLGEYFFRDVELNPKYDPDPFTRQTLSK